AVWQAPAIPVDAENADELKEKARKALAENRPFGSDDDAIPLYLALRGLGGRDTAPDDPEVEAGLGRALDALVTYANERLASIDEDPSNLGQAREAGSVAQAVAPDDPRVVAYMEQLELVERSQQASLRGERALNNGDIGED